MPRRFLRTTTCAAWLRSFSSAEFRRCAASTMQAASSASSRAKPSRRGLRARTLDEHRRSGAAYDRECPMSSAVAAARSRLPYLVLFGIVVAIAWGLYASGLAVDILRYRKDIVYLTK